MDNSTRFTAAQIKYIVCLYRLSKGESGVKNVEISSKLGVSKPSAHNMLRSLSGLGIVIQESFGLAFFTSKGLVIAKKYTECYDILEQKLSEICGTDAVSENALCSLLADMSCGRIEEIYNGKIGGAR